jgi:hypothetical protein
MDTKEAASIFLEKIKEYELKISKINNEPVDVDALDHLEDLIQEHEELKITFDIDNSEHTIMLSVDDESAVVVYDYHEVFDDIAEDIRTYQSCMGID